MRTANQRLQPSGEPLHFLTSADVVGLVSRKGSLYLLWWYGACRKLAIEVVGEENSRIRQGRTYRVYSQAEILRRRREAGYLWCYRNRAAVELVKMTDEAAIPSAQMPPAASNEDAALAEIRMWMGDDAAAAQELISLCRSADPNVSAGEILYFLKIDVASM